MHSFIQFLVTSLLVPSTFLPTFADLKILHRLRNTIDNDSYLLPLLFTAYEVCWTLVNMFGQWQSVSIEENVGFLLAFKDKSGICHLTHE